MGISHLGFLVQVPFSVAAQRRAGNQTGARCCLQQNHDDASQMTGPRKKKKRPSPRATTEARSIAEVSVGDQFIGTVCDVGPADNRWIDIGVATLTGKAVRARLRSSPDGMDSNKPDVVGGVLPVYVHKLNRSAARIEVRKGTPPLPRDEQVPENARMLDSVCVTEQLGGRVIALGPYGAVLDVNIFRHGRRGRIVPSPGLLPRKLFKEKWATDSDRLVRDDVERIVSVGDRLTVWVRVVRPPNGFLLLDSVPVDLEEVEEEKSEKKATFKRRHRLPSPETLIVGEHRHGRVRELAKFGLFVDIGVKTDGLIHYTEMGERHGRDWKEIINVGTDVVVEVLSVSGNRIGLRLLLLGNEETEEDEATALRASSPVARVGDVAKAETLKFTRYSEENLDYEHQDSLDVEAAPQPAVRTEGQNEVDATYQNDVESDEEDKDGDVEKFSDEYFEDKYGF